MFFMHDDIVTSWKYKSLWVWVVGRRLPENSVRQPTEPTKRVLAPPNDDIIFTNAETYEEAKEDCSTQDYGDYRDIYTDLKAAARRCANS